MSAATPSRRLPSERRIKRGRDFMRARSTGRRIVSGCLIFNWVEMGTGHATRVGIITTRKIGGSVVRSRARRLLREVFRLNQSQFARPVDLVLVARNSIVEKGFAEVETDFRAAARRAGLLNEPSTETRSA
jgi:ribonuclease P protein component